MRSALLAVGACSLIWQVASARAILSALHGNELILGLVLASWLALTGLATALVPRLPARWRFSTPLLATVLALLPLGLWASLALQYTLPAFSMLGQVVSPVRALLAALLCLLPCCVSLGLAFGLVAVQGQGESGQHDPARLAERVLVLESLGTIVAGVLFHLWLSRTSLQVAALAAAACCWLAALVTWRSHAVRSVRTLGAVVVGLLGLAGLVPGSPLTVSLRLDGFQLLQQVSSPHAQLRVVRRGDQRSLWANGVLVCTSQDRRQAESDVNLSLLLHPDPRRVLMIGGGLGGGLPQVLGHAAVQRVDYVELDPQLMMLARRWRMARGLDDPRVRLLLADGRQVVRASGGSVPRGPVPGPLRGGAYDVILVGMPGPSSALLNRYYTVEFFRQARRALRPGGLLRLRLQGTEGYLGPQMALVHASVHAALKQVFGNVTVLPAASTLMLAARGAALDTRFTTLVQRLHRRRLPTRSFAEAELMERTLPFKRQLYLQRLGEVRPVANTDLHPTLYFREVMTWLALTTPSAARLLVVAADWLQPRWYLVAAGAFALAMAWGLVRRRQRRIAVGLAMSSAGLCGLALELALILAAQEARGVVYRELAALLTAFMVGLALGAPAGRWLVHRTPRALQLGVSAVGLMALSSMLVMSRAPGHPDGALLWLLVQMLGLGVSVGMTYPAASAALHGHRSGAASAYAWDLGGAALGAVLACVVLPVLGLIGTGLACAGLCLGVGATVGMR